MRKSPAEQQETMTRDSVTPVGAENNSTTVPMIPSDFVTLSKSLSEYLREHGKHSTR
jgi:hypothetical protein